MANSTRSAKTKVIHAGFLLADPDIQPKSEQSILIEGERIKAVSGGFIDPPPGGELIDLRKKFVLPGLIDCHVHLTAQLDQGYRLRTVEDSDPKVAFNAAHNAAITLAAGFTTVRDGEASPWPTNRDAQDHVGHRLSGFGRFFPRGAGDDPRTA